MALTKISRSLLDTGISDSSDATAITIDSSEQVGIGVSPSATLQVKAASGNTGLYLQDAAGSPNISWLDAGGTVQWQVYSTMGGANGLDPLVIYSSAGEVARIDTAGQFVIGGTTAYGRLNLHGTGSTTASLTGIKESSFTSYDDNGSSAGSISGFFNFKATTGIGGGMGIIRESASDWGSAVAFYNHPSTTTNIGDLTERLRINSSGNVGMGGRLSVGTTTTGGGNTKIVATGGTDNYLQLVSNTGSGGVSLGNAGSVFLLYTHTGALGSESFSERMRIDSNGDLGWSTTSDVADSGAGTKGVFFSQSRYSFAGGTSTNTDGLIEINKTNSVASNNNVVVFQLDGSFQGDIDFNGGVVRYNTTSDYRRKENVTPLENATNQLKQLKTYNFNFIDNPDFTHQGFLAHEAQEVVPNAVSGSKDAVDSDGNPIYQTMDNSVLVPLLVKTIQELEARITTLEG